VASVAEAAVRLDDELFANLTEEQRSGLLALGPPGNRPTPSL
jgi:hypothetical protein